MTVLTLFRQIQEREAVAAPDKTGEWSLEVNHLWEEIEGHFLWGAHQWQMLESEINRTETIKDGYQFIAAFVRRPHQSSARIAGAIGLWRRLSKSRPEPAPVHLLQGLNEYFSAGSTDDAKATIVELAVGGRILTEVDAPVLRSSLSDDELQVEVMLILNRHPEIGLSVVQKWIALPEITSAQVRTMLIMMADAARPPSTLTPQQIIDFLHQVEKPLDPKRPAYQALHTFLNSYETYLTQNK